MSPHNTLAPTSRSRVDIVLRLTAAKILSLRRAYSPFLHTSATEACLQRRESACPSRKRSLRVAQLSSSRARTPLGARTATRGPNCARGCFRASASRSMSRARRRELPTSSVDARRNPMACAPRRSSPVPRFTDQAATSCETRRASSPSRPGSICDVRARADARSTRVESFFVDGRKHVEKRGKP